MLTVPGHELRDYLERELPPSEWLTIDQARINAFADATLDHQFIHVDTEKAGDGGRHTEPFLYRPRVLIPEGA